LFTSTGFRREFGPIRRGKGLYVTDVLENSFTNNVNAARERTEQVGTVIAIPCIRGVKSNWRRALSRGRESVRFRNLFSPPDPLTQGIEGVP
jgi:hypothetical protein